VYGSYPAGCRCSMGGMGDRPLVVSIMEAEDAVWLTGDGVMVQLYGCQMMNTTERGNTSWGAAGGETPPIQRLGGAGQRER